MQNQQDVLLDTLLTQAHEANTQEALQKVMGATKGMSSVDKASVFAEVVSNPRCDKDILKSIIEATSEMDDPNKGVVASREAKPILGKHTGEFVERSIQQKNSLGININ